MIKIRIKNADHEIDIRFPISESELFAKLGEIHAVEGRDAAQSALVTEVYWPEEFSMLKDRFANLDELNYLGKRMESFDTLEYDQFLIGISKLDSKDVKDLINLTFNLNHFTLCQDVSSYGKIGREYVLNTEGAVPAHDEDDPKYATIGKDLIDRGLAQITERGLLIYNPFDELEEVYDGHTFPEYYYINSLLSLNAEYGGRTELLQLPDEALAIKKAIDRLGAPSAEDCSYTVTFHNFKGDDWLARVQEIIAKEGIYVIVQDKRREPAGFPNEIPEFVQWLIEGVKECIEMLKSGTYNDFIKENLPPEHRIGKILRKHYWDVWPEARKEFFEDISAEDVAEFIRKASAQGEGSETIKERLPSMTANDFFRFCAMGYAENKYNGCDKTPKEQYYLHADGRDEGLKDLDPDDPEAFHAWLHDYSHGGGHPWEVCRGGNSTHVSLRPMDDKDGYFLYLDGDAWNRTIETVKFYLALTRAGIPVYLIEAHTLADRLAEKEWIGIVPDGVMPAYCESWFPNEHIIDYMNLPYDDREKFLPFCVWYDEEPIMLVTEKEAEPK